MRIIFRLRSIKWFFRSNWYTTGRWSSPFLNQEGEIVKLIDIGSITFGYAKKKKGAMRTSRRAISK